MKPAYTFLTIVLCMLMIQTGNAQCSARKGRCKKYGFWEVQAGAGLLPTFLKDHTQTLMPPVLLGINYRLKRNFSLGLQAGMSVSEALIKVPKKTNRDLHRNHFHVAGLRAMVNTTTLDHWEVYGGMMLGYNASTVEVFETNQEAQPSPLRTYSKGEAYLSAFIGGRYALNKNIGIFSELGLGISILSGGISWQFR